jgi:hypothetical protein
MASAENLEVILIEATQKKLREVLFFFAELSKLSTRVVRNDPEIFSYYLSAFLSAARSVTFALQWEEKEKYDKWFPDWGDALAEDDKELFRLCVRQRNQNEKRGSAEVSVVDEFIPLTEVRRDPQGHPAYGFHWASLPGSPPPEVGVSRSYFEFNGTQLEVTSACERYVRLLQKLVADFTHSYERPAY